MAGCVPHSAGAVAMVVRRKLIEVSLPLEDINKAAAREKSIRHGHPSTLHLWWSRKPLAACRGVLFAQLVDDPSTWPDRFKGETAQAVEREKLHDLIRRLVPWEASNDEAILNEARWHIARSVAWGNGGEPPPRDRPQAVLDYLQAEAPPVYDPFCGGGSIPLEAQRLGLRAIASDLNPVAVMITKALVEFPPRFKDREPVNQESRRQLPVGDWRGAQGLADDVRHYGKWMRDEAEKRIGHLYPKAKLADGTEATVIAWKWARTVRSPNPAAGGAMVPLVSSFMLSTRPGRQAWVEVVRDAAAPDGYRFEVRTGEPPEAAKSGTKASRGANFICALSDTPIAPTHVKTEGKASRMGARLLAIVAEGRGGRVYLAPTAEHELVAQSAQPTWRPEQSLPHDPRNFWTVDYGLTTFGDLFTPRQLVALTTFSDLVAEARERALADARTTDLPADPTPLADGGKGAVAYADAVAVYLALGVSRLADIQNSLCRWEASKTQVRNLFGRQAIPMIWDFGENNLFAQAAGDYQTSLHTLVRVLAEMEARAPGDVHARNAANGPAGSGWTIATDPPYYDNIGYADLSDFFYVWLRRMLGGRFPTEFATLVVPKEKELIASPYRHGSREKADAFFMSGMSRALKNIDTATEEDPPTTIYYAFKQTEIEREGVVSTGWATFLGAVLAAGFQVDGTWPMRTEMANRMIGQGTNALASSIVLVCRKRPADAVTATRAEFMRALERELPAAVRMLQGTAIAPVDLAQAAIGPGMAVFSRYARVLESDDRPMSVKTALALINHELDAILASEDADYDADTRFAIAWFEQHGHDAGSFGEANTLANAKAVAVAGVQEAGIVVAKAGKVRLLRRNELPEDWDPTTDPRLTVWKATQHLVARYQHGMAEGAAVLLARLPGRVADAARELAYRLYQVCNNRKWAAEALPYNALVADWPEIQRRTVGYATAAPRQAELALAAAE